MLWKPCRRWNGSAAGRGRSWSAPAGPPGTEPESDYPGFAALEYEAKFYEYIEKKLAAKFAVKLSEQPQIHASLLQEAMLIKQEAVAASRAGRAAKVKENPWWGDELGMEG